MTIFEAYQQASSFLKKHGVEDKETAMLLLEHVLSCSKAEILRDFQCPFPKKHWHMWQQFLHRKSTGEPLQYIIGSTVFYGLDFQVNPHVLIPRPETEILIEKILNYYSNAQPLRVVDVGTGSGAIALSLAHQRPAWKVTAVDISELALDVAKQNMQNHGLSIELVKGDLLSPVQERSWDIIVSNPPYIPLGHCESLMKEVRDYEPHLALFGGEDGLDCYRRILSQIQITPQLLAFEMGWDQNTQLKQLIRATNRFSKIESVKDYAQLDRHMLAFKNV